MAKRQGRETGIEGVTLLEGSLDAGVFRVRRRWKDPRFVPLQEVDRVVGLNAPMSRFRALEMLELLVKEKRSGSQPKRVERLILRESLEAWLESRRVGTLFKEPLRASSLCVYRGVVKAIRESLGDTYVDQLTPELTRQAMESWYARGDGINTINLRLKILRAWAKDSGHGHAVLHVPVLPAPPVAGDDTWGRSLSPQEFRAFLDQARKDEEWWPMLGTLATSGTRINEVCGLLLGNVNYRKDDEDYGLLAIRTSAYHGTLGKVKTRAGVRQVFLFGDVREAVRERAEGWAKRYSRIPTAGELLFRSTSRASKSGIIQADTVRRVLHDTIAWAGIDLGDRPPAHCFRHTYNNTARRLVSDVVRQRLVGHADESQNTVYSKASREEIRSGCASVFDALTGA